MGIISKVLGALLLLTLIGTGWTSFQLSLSKSKLDASKSEVSRLEGMVDLTQLEANVRADENERLGAILQARSKREAATQKTTRLIQEKINALPTGCVLSTAASRLLWEIYEGGTRVQATDNVGHATSAAD